MVAQKREEFGIFNYGQLNLGNRQQDWVYIPNWRGKSKYIGQVLRETITPHGKGICAYHDGILYEGWFKDGLRHGKGRFIGYYGDVEDCEHKDGERHGHWVITYPTGRKE